MKLGICLPNNWGLEDVQSIFRLATTAEQLGFDSVWVSEHVFNTSYILEKDVERKVRYLRSRLSVKRNPYCASALKAADPFLHGLP